MVANSPQEDLLHEFSQHMLGHQAIFFPDNFAGSKEPADLAWVANRCAILMYATESGGSFDKMKRHNTAQLHSWLRKWKAGQRLRGQSMNKKYNFGWDDIDHVIGLSIVSGRNAACQFSPEQVMYSESRSGGPYKLCVSITLTLNTVI